jgi:hypothetical protein
MTPDELDALDDEDFAAMIRLIEREAQSHRDAQAHRS